MHIFTLFLLIDGIFLKEILCHVGTFLDNNLVLIANKTVMFINSNGTLKTLKKKEDESRNTVFSIEKKYQI